MHCSKRIFRSVMKLGYSAQKRVQSKLGMTTVTIPKRYVYGHLMRHDYRAKLR